jgi:hypothetical protein
MRFVIPSISTGPPGRRRGRLPSTQRCRSRRWHETRFTTPSSTPTIGSSATTGGSGPGCGRCAASRPTAPRRSSSPGTRSCRTCAVATRNSASRRTRVYASTRPGCVQRSHRGDLIDRSGVAVETRWMIEQCNGAGLRACRWRRRQRRGRCHKRADGRSRPWRRRARAACGRWRGGGPTPGRCPIVGRS